MPIQTGNCAGEVLNSRSLSDWWKRAPSRQLFNLKTYLENTICHICACDSKGTNTILKGNKCVPCPEDKKAVQIFPEHGNNEHRSTPIYKCVKCNGGTVTDKGRDQRIKTFEPTATGAFSRTSSGRNYLDKSERFDEPGIKENVLVQRILSYWMANVFHALAEHYSIICWGHMVNVSPALVRVLSSTKKEIFHITSVFPCHRT